MNNVFLIWALAALPNFGSAIAILGGVMILVSIFIFMFSHEYSESEPSSSRLRKISLFTIVSGILFFVLGWLVPRQNDIVKAYLMIEGSKIITADNAEEASKEIIKKVDIVLDGVFKNEDASQKETEKDLSQKQMEIILEVIRQQQKKNEKE